MFASVGLYALKGAHNLNFPIIMIGGFGFTTYLIYTIIGFPVFIALFIKISEIRNFDYLESKKSLESKSDITTKSFYFSLYIEPNQFTSILNI